MECRLTGYLSVTQNKYKLSLLYYNLFNAKNANRSQSIVSKNPMVKKDYYNNNCNPFESIPNLNIPIYYKPAENIKKNSFNNCDKIVEKFQIDITTLCKDCTDYKSSNNCNMDNKLDIIFQDQYQYQCDTTDCYEKMNCIIRQCDRLCNNNN